MMAHTMAHAYSWDNALMAHTAAHVLAHTMAHRPIGATDGNDA